MVTNSDLFKKITFIIPIKERNNISKRLVKYLNNINLRLNLLIADGSLESQEKLFLPLNGRHKIIYKKFPFDKNTYLYANKLYNSSLIVNTEYCSIMESDELINFESYTYSIDYLEHNKRFNYVTGRMIDFDLLENSDIRIKKKQCHPNFNELKKNNFNMRMHPSCWEGIHRTRNLKISFENIIKSIDQNFEIIHLIKFFNIYTLTQGDAKFFQDKFITFRQANTAFFDIQKNLSASRMLKKSNRVKTFLLLKSLRYIYLMYLNVSKIINKNMKYHFLIYYSQNFCNVVIQDFNKLFYKFQNFIKSKLKIKHKSANNDQNQIILKGRHVYGYDYLTVDEKSKLSTYIENFTN